MTPTTTPSIMRCSVSRSTLMGSKSGFGRAVHGDEVAIEDAGIAHAHALHAQQVVRTGREERRVEAVARLDVLGGQDRLAGGDAPHQRDARRVTGRLEDLDAARDAGDELDDALALEGAEVLLGGIGRAEAELPGDLGPCRWHPSVVDDLLDEGEDFCLAVGELGHGRQPVYPNNCFYIQHPGGCRQQVPGTEPPPARASSANPRRRRGFFRAAGRHRVCDLTFFPSSCARRGAASRQLLDRQCSAGSNGLARSLGKALRSFQKQLFEV